LAQGRCHGDDGAVLVEAAMVLPLLATMILGAFEFGMGWRQNSYQSASIAAGVRQLATNGTARYADMYALQSFMAGMNQTRNLSINRVVIFEASSTGMPTNAACLTTAAVSTGTGITGACNIYSLTPLQNLTTANFGTTGTTCSSTAWDRYWCPLDQRKDAQGDPPDFVGMYVVSTYTPYTKLVPNSFTLTDKGFMQIEPKVN
jgi:Flp pilus assembly protein TadG